MPAAVGVGLVVPGLVWAFEDGPSPGGSTIVEIDANFLVRGSDKVVDLLVPPLAAIAHLVGRIPQDVRGSLPPAEGLVAPAERAVAVGRVESQYRAAELVIADVLRGVDCETH